MAEKVELLYDLYENDDKLCFCFSGDSRILWFNKKFKSTFPLIADGISVQSCFPHFDFTFILSENAPDHIIKIKDKYAKSFLEIIPFGNEKIFVGILHNISENNFLSEHQGIDLISYYIRQKTGRIFNLSEIMNKKLSESCDYESSHYLHDIEKICKSVLKLSTNFSAYYSILEEPTVHKTLTDFHEFLVPVMEQVDTILATTPLTFIFEPDIRNGLVMLDAPLFTTAILNIINISYLYTKQEGFFKCKTFFKSKELILTLEDNVTDYGEVLSSDYSNFTILDATGEPPAMKKICYDILKRTVALHGGKCEIEASNPGVKISISLPFEPSDGMSFSTPRVDPPRGRLGLVDIMLSDITY